MILNLNILYFRVYLLSDTPSHATGWLIHREDDIAKSSDIQILVRKGAFFIE